MDAGKFNLFKSKEEVYYTDDSYYSSYPFPPEWIELFKTKKKTDKPEFDESFAVGGNIKYEPVISPKEMSDVKTIRLDRTKNCTANTTGFGGRSGSTIHSKISSTNKKEAASCYPEVIKDKREEIKRELILELQGSLSVKSESAKRSKFRKKLMTEGEMDSYYNSGYTSGYASGYSSNYNSNTSEWSGYSAKSMNRANKKRIMWQNLYSGFAKP